MTFGHTGRPDHIVALLGYVMDTYRRELPTRMQSAPLDDAPESTRSLRPSQIRLLSLTPADGLRVTDLADRASGGAAAPTRHRRRQRRAETDCLSSAAARGGEPRAGVRRLPRGQCRAADD